jgi:hypothetical protein
METSNENYKQIKGWGIDADPEDQPNYPIKKYNGDDHNRLNWNRPPLQPVNEEILKSVEHPRMPAVFGTPLPPSGISGSIRRTAFKFDESEYGHWLNLLLADRINVVEGIVDDIRHGFFPNIFSERGMKADWKYNRKELVTKAVIAGTVITVLCLFSLRKSKNKNRSFQPVSE